MLLLLSAHTTVNASAYYEQLYPRLKARATEATPRLRRPSSRSSMLPDAEADALRLRGDLCGVTSYFNPSGGTSRLWQYRLFRERTKRQGLHLTTTELAFGDVEFGLSRDDADTLVHRRVSRENVLWQKERLLNLALEVLPGRCTKVERHTRVG